MESVNRVTIHGNVDRVASLEKSTKINITTNRSWTDEKGTRKQVNDWRQVTTLDEKQVAWAAENAKASDVVLAKGRITDSSIKMAGETIYMTDLIATTFDVFRKA
jgi:single-strand DNA-binding protein